jgi:hypothetical protein
MFSFRDPLDPAKPSILSRNGIDSGFRANYMDQRRLS